MRKEVVVKVRMPKDMYDDFVDTYSFVKDYYKDTQLYREKTLEEFISNRIVEIVEKNFVFVVKGERL